ncbi:MAG TPA: radical SAM protein [Polyangia bacterium]|nr:radical SAM protein [Polyangia bacterium]
MTYRGFRAIRDARLAAETGTIFKQAELAMALCYPSPYHVGMSSLGFQTIYRELCALPGVTAERAFLPDDARAARIAREPLCTYESGRPASDFPVLAFSLAYELELAGLVDCLDLAGIPVFAAERARRPERHPLVVVGGPLTFSNPVPAGPYADVMILGEAEELCAVLVDAVRDGGDRAACLQALARLPGFYVPSIHGEVLPPIAAAPDDRLPARSQIRTPHTELSDMFLIEPERGCHRGCTYCVMRRSTNGGMRLVDKARVLELIPPDARRVGLVGAAVTDHPQLPDILSAIVASRREVGISSLRADRLTPEIVGLLKRGGYRTLTTAADGASERLRDSIQRKTREKHLLRAATLCRDHGLRLLKLYMMLGLPGETMDDIDELGRFALELRAAAPRLALSIAPFVAKRNTPLDGSPFEPIASLSAKLDRLRSHLHGRAEVRLTSPKWAWVEYRLAQGGFAAGAAAAVATRAGGRFADWKAALADVPPPPVRDEPAAPPALPGPRRALPIAAV